jgi:hypothetical protein
MTGEKVQSSTDAGRFINRLFHPQPVVRRLLGITKEFQANVFCDPPLADIWKRTSRSADQRPGDSEEDDDPEKE